MPSMLSNIMSYNKKARSNKKDSGAKFPGSNLTLATCLLGDTEQILTLLCASVSVSVKGRIIIVPMSGSCFEDYMN